MAPDGTIIWPSISPGGKWIAFLTTKEDAKRVASWADVDLGRIRPFVPYGPHPPNGYWPRIGPKGPFRAWIVSASGGGAPRPVGGWAAREFVSWSPDGNRLAVHVSQDPQASWLKTLSSKIRLRRSLARAESYVASVDPNNLAGEAYALPADCQFCSFDRSGKLVYGAFEAGSVRVRNLATGRPINAWRVGEDSFQCGPFFGAGCVFAFGTDDALVIAQRRTYSVHLMDAGGGIFMSPDGSRIAGIRTGNLADSATSQAISLLMIIDRNGNHIDGGLGWTGISPLQIERTLIGWTPDGQNLLVRNWVRPGYGQVDLYEAKEHGRELGTVVTLQRGVTDVDWEPKHR